MSPRCPHAGTSPTSWLGMFRWARAQEAPGSGRACADDLTSSVGDLQAQPTAGDLRVGGGDPVALGRHRDAGAGLARFLRSHPEVRFCDGGADGGRMTMTHFADDAAMCVATVHHVRAWPPPTSGLNHPLPHRRGPRAAERRALQSRQVGDQGHGRTSLPGPRSSHQRCRRPMGRRSLGMGMTIRPGTPKDWTRALGRLLDPDTRSPSSLEGSRLEAQACSVRGIEWAMTYETANTTPLGKGRGRPATQSATPVPSGVCPPPT